MKKEILMKIKALEDLIEEMDSSIDDKYDGMDDEFKPQKMRKVSVIAKDDEGLKEGLSKAEQILQDYDKESSSEEECEDDEDKPNAPETENRKLSKKIKSFME